jgi:hypothetical protein
MSYPAMDSQVYSRQLKVQKVSIPFTVTANATPASKTRTVDEPALLFLRLEGAGQDDITVAKGALESGESLPAGLATAADATATGVGLLKINENIAKVMSVKLVGRGATDLLKSCQVLGPTTGTGGGQSIVFNFVGGVDLASVSLNAVFEVEYIVQE